MINFTDTAILKSSVKYLLPFAVTLSVVKQTIFYWFFEVNIWNYAGIDEILTPIIKDCVFYSIALVFPIIIILFKGDEIAKSNTTVRDKINSKNFPTRLLLSIWHDVWFLSYIILLIILLVKGKDFWHIFSYCGLNFLLFVVFFIRAELLLKHNVQLTKRNVTILNISNIVIAVFILNIWYCIVDAHAIKTKIGDEVTIMTEDETIFCKYSKQYIGRVKNYTFIYNVKTKKTEIILNENIKKEKFKF